MCLPSEGYIIYPNFKFQPNWSCNFGVKRFTNIGMISIIQTFTLYYTCSNDKTIGNYANKKLIYVKSQKWSPTDKKHRERCAYKRRKIIIAFREDCEKVISLSFWAKFLILNVVNNKPVTQKPSSPQPEVFNKRSENTSDTSYVNFRKVYIPWNIYLEPKRRLEH